MSFLKSGVYNSVYGNAIAWDGRRAVDLDLMEEVPFDVIDSSQFERPLEEEDQHFIRAATRLFGGQYRGY